MKKITKKQLLLALGLGAGTAFYTRFIEPRWLDITFDEVPLRKVPLKNPVKVVHLSDLHASSLSAIRFIEQASRIAISLKPDLICITGDFITGEFVHYERYKDVLSKLSTAIPVYACLGNHDGGYWAGSHKGYKDTEKVTSFLRSCKITCLTNEQRVIRIGKVKIRITMLGDLWARGLKPYKAFKNSPKDDMPGIVLLHNPDGKRNLFSYKWDIMFCGHTHGGQFQLPFIGAPFAPVRDKSLIDGLYRVKGRWLYITRGVGNVLGIRFNCRPQVSFLKLI